MAIWLNEQDIASVLTIEAAITTVENAFRELALGNVKMPQRVGLAGDGGGGAVMPAYVGGEDSGMGVKVVTLFSGNAAKGLPLINGTILLLAPDTGQLLAAMDAGHLTAVRTGAAGGVAIKYLAREDAETITLFGAGVQGEKQLEAACAVRRLRRALVVDLNRELATSFAAKMSKKLHIDVAVADAPQAAVAAADVLITATTAHEPIFDGTWLRAGVHINGIGSHAAHWRELDSTTVQSAKIVTDQTTACLEEAGDLIIPIQEGIINEASIRAQLGEIIVGEKPGRTDHTEITLFKSVGLAMQDIAVAQKVYQLAQSAGIGQTLVE
jgi:ornithine cyclodeaminase/alanine dehydrogenase